MSDFNNNNDDNRSPGGPFDFRKNRLAFFLFIGASLFLIYLWFSNDTSAARGISYSEFLRMVDSGDVLRVEILDNQLISAQVRSATNVLERVTLQIPYFDDSLIPKLIEKQVEVVGGSRPPNILSILLDFLPLIFLVFLFIIMYRQVQGSTGRAFGFGKSRAKRVDDKGKRVLFSDVAGQLEPKYELQEVVEFLKNPEKFTSIGAKIPKGVLLVGMPGTGKTLLAKAVAGEAGVPFFHMSGSDFVEMFVGVGASRVRDLFETGRRNAPCILFIDEIDAVGRTRGAGYGGGHDEREQTLNQLLVEMDGFDTKDGVIVIAATNRPDVLDPALLRPGRFDRQVEVSLPDVKEREEILKIHSKKIKLAPDVELDRLARATPMFSGADLANMVNEAALFAGRRGKALVDMKDFEEARDKILMGVARYSRVMPPKERTLTAYHESGHALLHYYLKNADPIHKVTIIPRGRSLGMASSLPETDRYSHNRGYLEDRIVITYGGYAAEELVFGETSSGVQQDLKQATNIARKMVTEWGMSPVLGPQSLGAEDEPIFLGKEIATHKDYSEETARLIDQEVRNILERNLNRARSILKEHRDQLDLLAQALLDRETLDDDDIRALLGFPPRNVEEN